MNITDDVFFQKRIMTAFILLVCRKQVSGGQLQLFYALLKTAALIPVFHLQLRLRYGKFFRRADNCMPDGIADFLHTFFIKIRAHPVMAYELIQRFHKGLFFPAQQILIQFVHKMYIHEIIARAV